MGNTISALAKQHVHSILTFYTVGIQSWLVLHELSRGRGVSKKQMRSWLSPENLVPHIGFCSILPSQFHLIKRDISQAKFFQNVYPNIILLCLYCPDYRLFHILVLDDVLGIDIVPDIV